MPAYFQGPDAPHTISRVTIGYPGMDKLLAHCGDLIQFWSGRIYNAP
jgi:hypothetical protein